MSNGDHTTADDADRANQAILNGFWVRAMTSLVETGIPWPDAAKSMLSIAVLQVEAALGADVAEKSLDAARDYMARKRDASDQLDKIVSSRPH